MKAKWLTLFSLVLVLAVAFSAVGPVQAQPSLKFNGGGNVEESPTGIYIVQMIDDPVVAYRGGINGLRATRPAPGQKINPNSPDVTRYVGYLKGRHDQALSRSGGQKVYDYVYSYNGFSARMSREQAIKLLSVEGVIAVNPDQIYSVDTSSTPDFLGLTDPGGLWDQLGGQGSGGEDIIIGIIDSGIWPESLSFTDRVDANGVPSADPGARRAYQQVPGWHGRCTPGENFTASMCNQKLIGAQYFNAAQGGDAGIDADRPWEFNSVRDYNGHGTHTASTSGGNYNVPTTGPATVFGSVSGIAPRARIAMYKALWSTESGDTASGNGADLVAAIDQAVADGVDVINYSISGTSTNFRDAAEIAFLFAADAGIFVATSAGNSGPTAATVAHPSPWITTVAAGTHNRDGQGSVTLGNGVTYNGASVATPVGPAPLIDATAAGLPGADPTQVALCYSSADGGNVLDPAKVAGKIVICQRGVTARVNKSLAVLEAGGVGMILYNNPDSSLNADFHFVPTVHVNLASGTAIKAYAATAGATATINASTIVYNAAAPFTASFSSRGPLKAGGGDLLKPDVMAPGQDILAAVSPVTAAGRDFNLLSGTSMSSPHVAGLGALLKDLHPDWTPMMVKSSLMTSAYDILDAASTANVIFRQGAGHVRPNSAANPGLVYNSNANDWFAFICATQPQGLEASLCTPLWNAGYSKNPSDFNVASIAIGDLAGIETVRRTVTNVSGQSLTVNATVTGVPGVNVVVNPSSLTLGAGQTASFDVTFTRTSAALNAYTGGYLTWNGGGYSVRSPIVINPVALAAPAQVTSNGTATSYTVKFGYDGAFTATARGLVPSIVTADTVADDPTDSTCSLTSPNAKLIPVTIPAGTTYARFAMFDAEVNPGSDIDLCVFQGTTLVGSSGSGTSAEEVNFVLGNGAANPIPLTVVVQGWGVVGSTPFKLHSFYVGNTAIGNMTVSAPASATTGGTGTINLSFSGLTAGTRYLGSVAYGGAAGMPNPTIVVVNP